MANDSLVVEPDTLELPDALEINAPDVIYAWVEENLTGLKYILVEEVVKRHNYNRIAKVIVQDKPSPFQKPDVKSDVIVRQVYLILQYQLEATDQEVNARIVLYRNGKSGRNVVKTKHVTVGTDITDEGSSRIYNPDRVDGDLVSQQSAYIAQIQDANAGLMEIATRLIKPLIEQNERLMMMTSHLAYGQVEQKRLELQAEHLRKVEEGETRLRMLEIEKKEAFRKHAMNKLYQSGGLTKIMEGASAALSGIMGGRSAAQQPKPKAPTKTKTTPEEESREEIIRKESELQKQQEAFEESMKKEPLRTQVNLLFRTMTEVKQNEGQLPRIKEMLRPELYDKFACLILAESEKDAIESFKDFSQSIEGSDLLTLKKIKDEILDEHQNKIIDFVMSFDVEDEEE